MKSSDTSSISPSDSAPPELPPSYEFATEYPADIGASSSASASTQVQTNQNNHVLKHNAHLYSGPTNAEPILGRQFVPAHELEHIITKTRGKKLQSWDPKLTNSDMLYDFLRAQTLRTPRLKLTCSGTHLETSMRDETYWENGTMKSRRRGQTERIVDFDFFIDLSPIINHPDNKANIHLYTTAPDVPAYRGTHDMTYSAIFAPPQLQRDHYHSIANDHPEEGTFAITDPGRQATRQHQQFWNSWHEWRIGKGIPGWSNVLSADEFWDSRASKGKKPAQNSRGENALMLRDTDEDEQVDEERGELARRAEVVREGWSRPSLKEWCDRYTRDHGLLKEFRMKREIWGWDLAGLEAAVRGAITSTGYESNDITVKFDLEEDEIIIHDGNILSRAVGHPFVYFLLWITLIFPLIWVWQRLSSNGGAKYDVACASYSTKFYPALPSTYPNETITSAQSRLGGLYKIHPELPKNPVLATGPKGVHYLLGRKEGEWYREWEERVRMGVRMRYQGELTGGRVDDGEGAVGLDGY